MHSTPASLSLCLPLQHLPRRQSGLVLSDSASTKRFRPRIRRAPTADRRLTDGRMQHSLVHSRASVCTACRGTSAIRPSPISAFSSVSYVQCHLSRPSCVSAARILRTAYPPRTSPSFDNSRVPRTCIPPEPSRGDGLVVGCSAARLTSPTDARLAFRFSSFERL